MISRMIVRHEKQAWAEDPENACTAEPSLAPNRIVRTWHKRPRATTVSPASSPKRPGCFRRLHGVSVGSSRHGNGENGQHVRLLCPGRQTHTCRTHIRAAACILTRNARQYTHLSTIAYKGTSEGEILMPEVASLGVSATQHDATTAPKFHLSSLRGLVPSLGLAWPSGPRARTIPIQRIGNLSHPCHRQTRDGYLG